jgi:hypothetical protein
VAPAGVPINIVAMCETGLPLHMTTVMPSIANMMSCLFRRIM